MGEMFARWVAIFRVRFNHAERICAPGKWVVWREGDAVRVRVMA